MCFPSSSTSILIRLTTMPSEHISDQYEREVFVKRQVHPPAVLIQEKLITTAVGGRHFNINI